MRPTAPVAFPAGHVVMTEQLIRLSTDWAAGFRARKAELGYSDAEVEHRGGLPAGYCNKILNAKKKPGAKKIEQLCQGLDLEVVLRPATGSGSPEKSSP